MNGVPGADTSGFFAAIKLDGEGSSALLPALAEVFDQVFRSVNARRAESGDGSSLVDVLAIPRNS
ncbi:MAG: hypothetical protein GY711_34225 [bacterium]|nr:hypothetical protein [bacterium]